jgi:hypothetical protein
MRWPALAAVGSAAVEIAALLSAFYFDFDV